MTRQRSGRGPSVAALLRIGLSVAVTAAVIAVLAHRLDEAALVEVLGRYDPGWLAAAALWSLTIPVLRAWRLAAAARVPLDLDITRISVMHNLLAATIPARLGDVSLPVMLNRSRGLRLGRAVGILAAVRLHDFIAVSLLASLGIAVAGERAPWLGIPGAGWAALLGLLGGAACLALALALPRVAGLAARAVRGHRRLPRRLAEAADAAAGALADQSRREAAVLVTATVASWVAVAVTFWLVSRAAGLEPPAPAVMMGVAAYALSFALPVNGIANIGAAQAAWAAVLAAFGIAWEPALLAGIVLQLMALATSAGLAGLLSFARPRG